MRFTIQVNHNLLTLWVELMLMIHDSQQQRNTTIISTFKSHVVNLKMIFNPHKTENKAKLKWIEDWNLILWWYEKSLFCSESQTRTFRGWEAKKRVCWGSTQREEKVLFYPSETKMDVVWSNPRVKNKSRVKRTSN